MENKAYKTCNYKVYVLKDGYTYSPDGMNIYDHLDICLEEAFAMYHNKKTMMLTWQNIGEDFCLYSTVFICQDDKKILAHSIAACVYDEISNNLLQAIGSALLSVK